MPLLKWLVRSGSSGYLYSWNTIPFRLRVCPWDVRKLRLNGNSQQCSENAFWNLAITYLLLLPKIAVNFVLYSGKCLERVIKPAATFQVRNKCWEILLSWKDHAEGQCSEPDATIDSSSVSFLIERKRRLYFEEREGNTIYTCIYYIYYI